MRKLIVRVTSALLGVFFLAVSIIMLTTGHSLGLWGDISGPYIGVCFIYAAIKGRFP
jgi:hypothetical protein